MIKNCERKSNFELLRLLAIFLVITSHFNVHGIVNQSLYTFNFNYFLKSIFITGCIANNIFILITGYFMIKSKPNYKKIISLMLDMLFYSVIIYLILCVLGVSTFNLSNSIKSLFPIFFGNWFCIYYIILYLLIPVLNDILTNVSRSKLNKIVFMFFIIVSFIPTITNNSWHLSNLACFILSYMIGGYIRLYFNKKNNTKKIISFIFIDIVFLVLSVFVFYILGIILNNSTLIKNSSYFLFSNYSVFVVILSVLLFLLFKNLNIRNNKYLNWLSSSVLGVYLIHDNYLIRNIIWNDIIPNQLFIDKWYFFLFAFCKITLVFIVCLIIDKLRIFIFGNLHNKITEKLYNFICKLYKYIINTIIKLDIKLS